MPVERIVAADHSRARSLGWLAVRWIEFFCLHGPGDIQGTPLNIAMPGAIPLGDELVELTVDVYALSETGHRLYDSVYYSRAKGCDKSGHAGRLGLFEALGPCRFAGWAKGGEVFEQMDFRYVYEAGEPMGRILTYPFLRILATEEEQAGNVYDTMYFNLKDGPLSEAFHRKDDVGLTRVFLPDGGEIRPSTASNAAKDGGLETWCSFDESHLYITPELRRMHATVRRNLTKRKEAEPWSSEMSTMYAPGQDSIAERSHERANLIRDGRLRMPRAYFNHRQAPMEINIADEAELRAGLLEAYGDAASYTDMDRKVAEIYDPVNNVDDSYRYFLNQARTFTQSWVTPEQWDAIAMPAIPLPGRLIALGLQGPPRSGDVALIGADIESGQLFKIGLWTPPEGGEIDRKAIDEAVEDAFQRYDVVGFYADGRNWESYIDSWEQRHSSTLCSQASAKHPIRWDMNAPAPEQSDNEALDSRKPVVKATEDFHAAIVEAARLMALLPADGPDRDAQLALVPVTHDGDREFRQQLLNARRDIRAGKGVVLGPETAASTLKVNGAKAALLAFQCRRDYLALPAARKREPSYGWVIA